MGSGACIDGVGDGWDGAVVVGIDGSEGVITVSGNGDGANACDGGGLSRCEGTA